MYNVQGGYRGFRWLQETHRRKWWFFVTDKHTLHHNIYIIIVITIVNIIVIIIITIIVTLTLTQWWMWWQYWMANKNPRAQRPSQQNVLFEWNLWVKIVQAVAGDLAQMTSPSPPLASSSSTSSSPSGISPGTNCHGHHRDHHHHHRGHYRHHHHLYHHHPNRQTFQLLATKTTTITPRINNILTISGTPGLETPLYTFTLPDLTTYPGTFTSSKTVEKPRRFCTL